MRPVLLASLACALAGCAGGMLSTRDELKLAIQDFNDGVRWGKVEQSAARLPIEGRAGFAERYAALEDDLEIMDYDVQRVDLDRAAERALVRVDMSWSLKRRGLVERTVVEQDWRKKGGWMLVSARRLKGSPLPLLEVAGPTPPPAAPAPGANPAAPPPSTDPAAAPTGPNAP